MNITIPLVLAWLSAVCRVTLGLPVLDKIIDALEHKGAGVFQTPFGLLKNGTSTASGVQRFVVRYATATRWRAPAVASSLHTLSSLPLVCPQVTDPDSGAWTGSEDCLYVVFYVPVNVRPTSVLTWIHGGSLIVGGANDPMIEGSKLALATKSVVAVIQYRLGVLGFLPPAGINPNSNLGVRDAIAALTFINKVVPAFGSGLQNSVTLAGQSSGATMIRALLAAPSASKLFSKAILMSDTVDYGFFKPTTISTFQKAYFPSVNCSTTNASCQTALSLASIMSAQNDFLPGVASLDAAASGPLALRPVIDNQLITSTLTTTFPSSLKPLLITNVKDEAGPTIFGSIPQLPNDLFPDVLRSVIPDSRADSILNSKFYALKNSDDALRNTLMQVVTDLAFRCADWGLAREWSSRGGSAFLGTFLAGATHPANDGIPFCTSTDAVCHQDDIPIVFGTARSPSAAQKQLIDDVQKHIAAFVQTGNPNTPGTSSRSAWARASAAPDTISVSVRPLGGSGPVDMGACVKSFWGSRIAQFDYQIYGL